MTETELKAYIQTHFPIENEACEWKEFKSLKHSFSGKDGDDISSEISNWKATKSDIDNLILDILPEILDKQKKANKVKNLIYAMSKRDKTIVNQGTTRYPKWEKV